MRAYPQYPEPVAIPMPSQQDERTLREQAAEGDEYSASELLRRAKQRLADSFEAEEAKPIGRATKNSRERCYIYRASADGCTVDEIVDITGWNLKRVQKIVNSRR